MVVREEQCVSSNLEEGDVVGAPRLCLLLRVKAVFRKDSEERGKLLQDARLRLQNQRPVDWGAQLRSEGGNHVKIEHELDATKEVLCQQVLHRTFGAFQALFFPCKEAAVQCHGRRVGHVVLDQL